MGIDTHAVVGGKTAEGSIVGTPNVSIVIVNGQRHRDK